MVIDPGIARTRGRVLASLLSVAQESHLEAAWLETPEDVNVRTLT